MGSDPAHEPVIAPLRCLNAQRQKDTVIAEPVGAVRFRPHDVVGISRSMAGETDWPDSAATVGDGGLIYQATTTGWHLPLALSVPATTGSCR